MSDSIICLGMSKKHFIQTDADGNSKLSSLRESLALALGTLTTNVIVFSLDNVVVSGRITALDVTWAAHGSPYYSTEKLNTVANDNKAKVNSMYLFLILYLSYFTLLNLTCSYLNVHV